MAQAWLAPAVAQAPHHCDIARNGRDLPFGVVTPAGDTAVRKRGAGMIVAGAKLHHHDANGRLTQLTAGVVPPADEGIVGHERARVLLARCHAPDANGRVVGG